MQKKNDVGHFIPPYTKINSKWIKDLKVTPITIKLLEENISGKLLNIALNNIFLIFSPRVRRIKEKINKWNYIKLKKFLHSKGNHQQNKKIV